MSYFAACSKNLLRCTLFLSLLVLGACQQQDMSSEASIARATELTLTEVFRIGDETAGDTVLSAVTLKWPLTQGDSYS